MTPTELNNYRKLDKKSGTIEDLMSMIGTASLEKVTYVHLDAQLPVIGIAPSHGGATDEDVEFYLNKIINGLTTIEQYELRLTPINTGVLKSNIKKISMISEAKILLRNNSNQFHKIASFFNGSSNTDDIEVEIRVKRKPHSRIDIKKQIEPLLNSIQNDSENKEFAEAHLRGKINAANETIKDISLDQSMTLSDIINTNSTKTIENQIQDKRYANTQVESLANEEFSKYSNKLKTSAPCLLWSKLKDPISYQE